MFYWSSLKCVLVYYILEDTTKVFASHKRATEYKIDEFIDKLLASKKFEVLTDKFAQKAVERMINLKPKLRFTKDFTADLDQQEVLFNNVSHKTDVKLEDISSLKNLSLKFKDFTKGFYEPIEKNNDEVKAIEESTAKISTESVKVNTGSTDNADDNSISLSELDTSLDKSDNVTEISGDTVQEENDISSKRNKTIMQEVKDESLSLENKKNAGLLSEHELFHDPKTNESRIAGAISDFDNNVKKDRALFSKESYETPKTKEFKTPHRKRIHREGNRLYTFQSSSDYDEYHQELARVEQKRKLFV